MKADSPIMRRLMIAEAQRKARENRAAALRGDARFEVILPDRAKGLPCVGIGHAPREVAPSPQPLSRWARGLSTLRRWLFG